MPQPQPEVEVPAEPNASAQQNQRPEIAAWLANTLADSQGESQEEFGHLEPSSASHAMPANPPILGSDASVADAPSGSAEAPRAPRTRGPNIHTSPAVLDTISPPGCRISIN